MIVLCEVLTLFIDSLGGGARPFSLGVVISLVDSFNERDLSLLNSVKYDSSLITFSL